MVLTPSSGQAGRVPAEELDDLVQRLVVAKYALEAEDPETAAASIDRALATARRLLTDARGDQLIRRHPAS